MQLNKLNPELLRERLACSVCSAVPGSEGVALYLFIPLDSGVMVFRCLLGAIELPKREDDLPMYYTGGKVLVGGIFKQVELEAFESV